MVPPLVRHLPQSDSFGERAWIRACDSWGDVWLSREGSWTMRSVVAGVSADGRTQVGGTMAVMVRPSDQISDRDVSGRPGTPQMTGVIKTGSVGETWDGWDAQTPLGSGLVCS